MNKKEAERLEQKRQEEIMKIRMPKKDVLEQLGVVLQLHGSDQIKVACDDGQERMCRIPGKLRKRVWMREGDIVIIRLWDFQPSKADIIWRYTGVQAEHLRKKGFLENLPV